MGRWIKLTIILLATAGLLSQNTKAQTDTTKTVIQLSTENQEKELLQNQEIKRQRNKTETKVFVSCLLLVLTTLLLYNVRSK
jgi:hypothetical protein